MGTEPQLPPAVIHLLTHPLVGFFSLFCLTLSFPHLCFLGSSPNSTTRTQVLVSASQELRKEQRKTWLVAVFSWTGRPMGSKKYPGCWQWAETSCLLRWKVACNLNSSGTSVLGGFLGDPAANLQSAYYNYTLSWTGKSEPERRILRAYL